jgi:predicted DNA-binding transcriptional regulator YafY
MKDDTAIRIAQALQVFKLDGRENYTIQQLADASGISRKTLQRNHDIVDILDFVTNVEDYDQCIIYM